MGQGKVRFQEKLRICCGKCLIASIDIRDDDR